jgi:hypothetical protein
MSMARMRGNSGGMETPLQPTVREGSGNPGKGRNGLEECDGPEGVDCGGARALRDGGPCRPGGDACRATGNTGPILTTRRVTHHTTHTTQHNTTRKKQRGADALAHLAAMFLGSVPRVALDAVPGVWPSPLSVCLSV